MAIFHGYYPQDIYICRDEVKGWADAVGLICITGQGFLTKNGLTTKNSDYYFDFRSSAPAKYPNSVSGASSRTSPKSPPSG